MADPTQIYRTVFHDWWSDMMQDGQPDARDRATVAILRRLDLVEGLNGPEPDVVGALMVQGFRRLRDRVAGIEKAAGHKMSDEKEMALTIAARALADLRVHQALHPASALGGDPPVMSESRFKAFMRADNDADLFDHARRIAALIGKTATDTGELGRSLYLWRRSPAIRRDWARRYYELDRGGQEVPASASADI